MPPPDERQPAPPVSSRDVAVRAVRGSAYNTSAGAITLVLGLTRTILLFRLLPPADFGIFALAMFFNGLAGQLRAVGLDAAFVQRSEADAGTFSTFFAFKMALLAGSLALLLASVPLISWFYPEMPSLAVVILACAGIVVVNSLNAVQEAVLTRNLEFRALARNRVAASAAMLVVAPLMAWYGFGVWSLVGEHLTGALARFALVWGPFRPWRPRLGWNGEVARSFWRYGRRVWSSHNLGFVLHRFDDFWIGTFLGQVPLGLYSRAYDLSRYAERAVGSPILVAMPTFARLQHDRLRLSQSFFRIAGFVVRLETGAALLLVLTAPEGVRLILGERWLPMVPAFQLLLLFVTSELFAEVMHQLFLAVGRPDVLVRVRLGQVLVFVPAVVLLGGTWGIAGVALASVLMVALGLVLLLRAARAHADFSLRRLCLWPLAALVVVPVVVVLSSPLWSGHALWLAIAGKAALVTILYGGLLWITEREQLVGGVRLVRELLVAS